MVKSHKKLQSTGFCDNDLRATIVIKWLQFASGSLIFFQRWINQHQQRVLNRHLMWTFSSSNPSQSPTTSPSCTFTPHLKYFSDCPHFDWMQNPFEIFGLSSHNKLFQSQKRSFPRQGFAHLGSNFPELVGCVNMSGSVSFCFFFF